MRNHNNSAIKSNAEAIEDAARIQEQTKAAVYRIQQQTAQTEELGISTLEELQQQRLTMDKIELDAKHVNDQLGKSIGLQNRLDRWAGRWGGRDRKEAKAEAKVEYERELALQRIEKGKKSADSNTKSVLADRSTSQQAVEEAPTSSPSPTNRSKLLVKRPPKNKPVVDSATESLDADTKAGLEQIAEKDDELDKMLSQAALSLDRLANLSNTIKDETAQQNDKLESLNRSMDSVVVRQKEVNSRARRFLGASFRSKTEQS